MSDVPRIDLARVGTFVQSAAAAARTSRGRDSQHERRRQGQAQLHGLYAAAMSAAELNTGAYDDHGRRPDDATHPRGEAANAELHVDRLV